MIKTLSDAKVTVTQILAVILSSTGSIADGMQIGWSAFLLFVLNTQPTNIHKSDIIWIESCYQIGGIITLPFGSILMNRYGRKATIIISNLIALVGWCIIAFPTPPVALLYLARLFTGAGSDVYYISATTYVSEISDKKVRGLFVSYVYVMLVAGTLVIYTIGPHLPSLAVGGIGIGLILVTISTIPFLPESPYFLVLKSRLAEAKDALLRLKGGAGVDEELEEIKFLIEQQNKEGKGRFLDLITNKNHREVVVLSAILTGGMSVNNVLVMNLHGILSEARSVQFDAYYVSIIFCVCVLTSSVVGSLLVDRIGRKVLVVASSSLTGLSFLVLGVFFHCETLLVKYNWILTAAILFYAIVFKIGIGTISFVIISELFATKVRAAGLTVAEGFYLVFSLVNIQIFNHFSRLWGIFVPFYVFAVLCFGVAVLAKWLLQETKGKSLKEIQEFQVPKSKNKKLKGAVNEGMKMDEMNVETCITRC